MNLAVSKELIISTVYKVCKEEGIEVRHEYSPKSDSVYFMMDYCGTGTTFRISDHPRVQKEGHYVTIKTLLIKKSTDRKLIAKFVRNRISGVKTKSLMAAFDLIRYQNNCVATA